MTLGQAVKLTGGLAGLATAQRFTFAVAELRHRLLQKERVRTARQKMLLQEQRQRQQALPPPPDGLSTPSSTTTIR